MLGYTFHGRPFILAQRGPDNEPGQTQFHINAVHVCFIVLLVLGIHNPSGRVLRCPKYRASWHIRTLVARCVSVWLCVTECVCVWTEATVNWSIPTVGTYTHKCWRKRKKLSFLHTCRTRLTKETQTIFWDMRAVRQFYTFTCWNDACSDIWSLYMFRRWFTFGPFAKSNENAIANENEWYTTYTYKQYATTIACGCALIRWDITSVIIITM